MPNKGSALDTKSHNTPLRLGILQAYFQYLPHSRLPTACVQFTKIPKVMHTNQGLGSFQHQLKKMDIRAISTINCNARWNKCVFGVYVTLLEFELLLRYKWIEVKIIDSLPLY